MGMLTWLFGSDEDEVNDGAITVVQDCGRVLVRGTPRPGDSPTVRADKRAGVVVSSDKEIEAVRRKWGEV